MTTTGVVGAVIDGGSNLLGHEVCETKVGCVITYLSMETHACDLLLDVTQTYLTLRVISMQRY